MVDRKLSSAYPAHWEADVVLRDGTTAHLRPITPADAQALQAMHKLQSQTSVYLRYFTYKSALTAKELDRFTHVDHRDRVAITVLRGERIIGVGRYDRLDDPSQAEVAFNVADEFQGTGIGSILLEHLAAAARENGIGKFVAEVLPENRKMITVFSEAGYAVAKRFEDGVVMLEFSIDPTDRSREVTEAREHRSESQSVAGLLSPRSIAVVGASRNWGSLGRDVLDRIVESGFTGAVYAVNEQAFEIGGLPSYAKLSEIPDPIDLAVICVPRDRVAQVVADGASNGIKGLLVMSAGYDDETGLAAQRELVTLARANGMRVVGPASLGLFNTAPGVKLNASLAQALPEDGVVGLFSQSAAVGMMLHAEVRRRDLGLSSAISAGLRADVSGNDAMQYFEDDPRTSVVAMHLESFGNPRKFARIARRLARSKPVIVAKSDLSGRRVPPGHAALTSKAPPAALNAMLRQSGVIRVRSADELMDVATLLSCFASPTGPNVAVLSNSPTLADIVCEAATDRNLQPQAIAMDPTADPQLGQSRMMPVLRRQLQELVDDAQHHAVIVALLPQLGVDPRAMAELLAEFAGADRPVLGLFPGYLGQSVRAGVSHSVPLYTSAHDAVGALGKAYGYRQWLEVPFEAVTQPEGIDAHKATEFLDSIAHRVHGTRLTKLDFAQCATLLGCYGIEVFPSLRVYSADEAVAAAAQLGWPVALKADDPDLRQRLDLGGVRLDLHDEDSLRATYGYMSAQMSARGIGALEVQSMAPAGQACVLQALEDPLLGPVLSFGLAGDATNLLEDWAHAVPPLSTHDIAALIDRPRTSARLSGYQGLPAVDRGALCELISRIALLKDNHPEVAILRLSPVMAGPTGVQVLGVEIHVGNATQRTDSVRRAMRG
ncbi:bifunctional acetate--CoA ligase family protein/GNAT family N-acetyltransferase [Glutamicibacter endophyticus]